MKEKIKLKNGSIQGFKSNGVTKFLGIPYG